MAALDLVVLVNDFNAKAFLLVVMACYMLFCFWKLKQFKPLIDLSLSDKLIFLGMWVYSRVTLFFYPFMVVGFLHINTTLDEMVVLVSSFYSIVMVLTFGILIIIGLEKFLKAIGADKGGMYK